MVGEKRCSPRANAQALTVCPVHKGHLQFNTSDELRTGTADSSARPATASSAACCSCFKSCARSCAVAAVDPCEEVHKTGLGFNVSVSNELKEVHADLLHFQRHLHDEGLSFQHQCLTPKRSRGRLQGSTSPRRR